ncbi:unnamed protein product [Amoebophrya sp. A120]|nr:unnamed protein product [Amoebophrya sp. A120]|eukprot:GSA120T00025243001.1
MRLLQNLSNSSSTPAASSATSATFEPSDQANSPTRTSLEEALPAASTGNDIACGFMDGTVAIFDTQNGTLKRQLAGDTSHHFAVSCLAYSEAAKKLVSGGFDNRLLVWNPFTGNGRLVEKNQHSAALVGVEFLGRGGSATSGSTSGGGGRGSHPHQTGGAGPVNKRMATSRHNFFVSADEAGVCKVFDVFQLTCVQSFSAVATIASANPSAGGSRKIISTMCFVPECARIVLAGCGAKSWLVFDDASSTDTALTSSSGAGASSDSTGRTNAVGNRGGGLKMLPTSATSAGAVTPVADEQTVCRAVFHRNRVWTANTGNRIRTWNAASGHLERTLSAFSAAGSCSSSMMSNGSDCARTSKATQSRARSGQDQQDAFITDMCLELPSERRLYVADSLGRIAEWNGITFNFRRFLPNEHVGEISQLHWCGKHQSLLSVGADKALMIHDCEATSGSRDKHASGDVVERGDVQHNFSCFKNKMTATSSTTGRAPQHLHQHQQHPNVVAGAARSTTTSSSAATSPSTSGSTTRATTRGPCRVVTNCHDADILCVAFSPVLDAIATGGSDRVIHLRNYAKLSQYPGGVLASAGAAAAPSSAAAAQHASTTGAFLAGHSGRVTALQFVDYLLISGDSEGNVMLWRLDILQPGVRGRSGGQRRTPPAKETGGLRELHGNYATEVLEVVQQQNGAQSTSGTEQQPARREKDQRDFCEIALVSRFLNVRSTMDQPRCITAFAFHLILEPPDASFLEGGGSATTGEHQATTATKTFVPRSNYYGAATRPAAGTTPGESRGRNEVVAEDEECATDLAYELRLFIGDESGALRCWDLTRALMVEDDPSEMLNYAGRTASPAVDVKVQSHEFHLLEEVTAIGGSTLGCLLDLPSRRRAARPGPESLLGGTVSRAAISNGRPASTAPATSGRTGVNTAQTRRVRTGAASRSAMGGQLLNQQLHGAASGLVNRAEMLKSMGSNSSGSGSVKVNAGVAEVDGSLAAKLAVAQSAEYRKKLQRKHLPLVAELLEDASSFNERGNGTVLQREAEDVHCEGSFAGRAITSIQLIENTSPSDDGRREVKTNHRLGDVVFDENKSSSPRSAVLLTAGADRRVSVWSAETLERLCELDLYDHTIGCWLPLSTVDSCDEKTAVREVIAEAHRLERLMIASEGVALLDKVGCN